LTKDSIFAKDISFTYSLRNFEIYTKTKNLLLSFSEVNYHTDVISAYEYNRVIFLWKQLSKGNRIRFYFSF